MRALSSWLAFAVLGCGGSVDLGDSATSGTRLKLTWYDIDSGPRTWSLAPGYFDAMLETACLPQRWLDGTTRCTPGSATPYPIASGYADAGCTQPITDRPGPYLARLDDACTDPYLVATLYRVGEPVQYPTSWQLDATGTCIEVGPASGRPIAEIPPVDLVEIASTELADGDPTFRIRIETSADGMSRPVALRDRAIAADCRLQPNTEGTTATCRPITTRTTEAPYHADATCGDPGAFPTRATCDAPTIAIEAECGAYHQVLPAEVTPTHVDHAGTCSPSTLEPGMAFYRIGERIDLAVLPRTIGDAGRISEIFVTAGSHRIRDGLYDAMLGTGCELLEIPDGTVRCIPTTTNVLVPFYRDAQCSSEVRLAAPVAGGCTGPASRYAVDTTVTQDARIVARTVHVIDAPFAGPVYVSTLAGSCEPIDIATSGYSTIGPPIAFTDFALATPSYE